MYYIINAYGDLVVSFETRKECENYLNELDPMDLLGYQIIISR